MSRRHDKLPRSQERLQALHGRLLEHLDWYPYPVFLSVLLVLVLTAHLLSGTNPRMGNPADIISFAAEQHQDSSLWMTVTPINGDIVVTTGDRQVFRWSQSLATADGASARGFKEFLAYLRRRVNTEIAAAALLKRAMYTQTMAVVAADQRLKFLHLRPVLYAFAQAGITQYAFETLKPAVALAPGVHNHQHEH